MTSSRSWRTPTANPQIPEFHPKPNAKKMMPSTHTHAAALLAVLDAASIELVNPDGVGVALAHAITERHASDRLAAVSYLALLTSITECLASGLKVAAIEEDHRAEQSLDADDADAVAFHDRHELATKYLAKAHKATLKAAQAAQDATDHAAAV
jgi:hypothetical protein